MIAERITRFACVVGLRRARCKQFEEPRDPFELEITFVERNGRHKNRGKRVDRNFDAGIARKHADARQIRTHRARFVGRRSLADLDANAARLDRKQFFSDHDIPNEGFRLLLRNSRSARKRGEQIADPERLQQRRTERAELRRRFYVEIMRNKIIVYQIEINAEQRAAAGKNVYDFVCIGIEFERHVSRIVRGKAGERNEEIQNTVLVVIEQIKVQEDPFAVFVLIDVRKFDVQIQIGVYRYGFIRRVDHERIFTARIILYLTAHVILRCLFRAVLRLRRNNVAFSERNGKIARRKRIDGGARVIEQLDKIVRAEIIARRHGGHAALEHAKTARKREFFVLIRQHRTEESVFSRVQQFRFERAERQRADSVRAYGRADRDLSKQRRVEFLRKACE